MILLNTTFGVDANLADDFLDFIRQTYIPLGYASGLYAALLTEVRIDEPTVNIMTQEPTRSFALQMRAPSQAIADDFRRDIQPRLYHEIGKSWGMGVGLFESVLDVLHDPDKE